MASTTKVPNTAHAVPMTTQPLACPAPVLTADFDSCSVPGGLELWQNWGYYSPGVCFIGYVALCTQTVAPPGGWSIGKDETAVRGYECNDKTSDQRYATSLYNDMTLSAPAFDIRWRAGDVNGQFSRPPTIPPSTSEPTASRSTGTTVSNSSVASPAPSGTTHNGHNRTGNMSSGKIAGITIGAAIAMCAVLAAALRMHFRRKHASAKAPLKAQSGRGHGEAAELEHVAPLAELQSEVAAKELASNRPKQYDDYAAVNKEPVELPGDAVFRTLP